MIFRYTAFHNNVPDGISGRRKKRSNAGTFFLTTTIQPGTLMMSSSLAYTDSSLPIDYSTSAAVLNEIAHHWHNRQAIRRSPAVTALEL